MENKCPNCKYDLSPQLIKDYAREQFYYCEMACPNCGNPVRVVTGIKIRFFIHPGTHDPYKRKVVSIDEIP